MKGLAMANFEEVRLDVKTVRELDDIVRHSKGLDNTQGFDDIVQRLKNLNVKTFEELLASDAPLAFKILMSNLRLKLATGASMNTKLVERKAFTEITSKHGSAKVLILLTNKRLTDEYRPGTRVSIHLARRARRSKIITVTIPK